MGAVPVQLTAGWLQNADARADQAYPDLRALDQLRSRRLRLNSSGASRHSILWQYSQSPLIELPSAAMWPSSWQRKQPFDVM
jgi:hypothetical protein